MTTTHRFKAVPTSSFTGEDLDWMIGMRMMRRLVHSWSSDNFIIDSAGELGIYTQVPRNRRPSSFFFRSFWQSKIRTITPITHYQHSFILTRTPRAFERRVGGQWLVGHLAAGGGPPCQSFSGYVKWQPRNSQSRPRPENNCRKESRKSSRIWILPFHRFDLFTKKNKKAGGIRMVGYKYLPFHPHYSQIIHKHSRNSSEEIGSPTRPRDSTYIKRSKNF